MGFNNWILLLDPAHSFISRPNNKILVPLLRKFRQSLTIAFTIAVMGEEKEMEGVASIALIENGSISGHFIHLPHSICYGIHGTEMVCERECSRGEDYRLLKLTIIDYNRKRERDVIVECRGHDAARIQNVDHAHGWEDDVVNMLDKKDQKNKILVSFECETLKAGKAAEDHINKFMPKLAGADAVVNIGKMRIVGLDFEDANGDGDDNQQNI
ncbi:uncharacterized protein LOC132617684 isoform X1 [Lycium barbarum]|uniref:uncharacterized protein LOC132617684 isoform X1 n=1 Tax=Lycium barbarum TaxID=112863 RepID=UPI00293E714A|nr:uncharacterized protein LOC132617684 isoform X1 [Lycium barbarum]